MEPEKSIIRTKITKKAINFIVHKMREYYFVENSIIYLNELIKMRNHSDAKVEKKSAHHTKNTVKYFLFCFVFGIVIRNVRKFMQKCVIEQVWKITLVDFGMGSVLIMMQSISWNKLLSGVISFFVMTTASTERHSLLHLTL